MDRITDLHDFNMEAASLHCNDCSWYGDENELEFGFCPNCGDDCMDIDVVEPDAEDKLHMISFMAKFVLELSQKNDKALPMFEINGINSTITFRVLRVGGGIKYGNYNDEISYKGDWDYRMFREWIVEIDRLLGELA